MNPHRTPKTGSVWPTLLVKIADRKKGRVNRHFQASWSLFHKPRDAGVEVLAIEISRNIRNICQNGASAGCLSRHITTGSSTRSLWSSSAPLLQVPFRRTSFGKRSFSTAAPSVWNSLPTSVLNCDSLTLFKARLKNSSFLFCFWLIGSTCPPQRLWSYTTTALYKSCIIIRPRRSLNVLSVCPCVQLQWIVGKRRIGSGCRLAP